jgi:hypothetical protein
LAEQAGAMTPGIRCQLQGISVVKGRRTHRVTAHQNLATWSL